MSSIHRAQFIPARDSRNGSYLRRGKIVALRVSRRNMQVSCPNLSESFRSNFG